MKIKKYEILSDIDFEKICYATLKKVFSPTLFPRVLSNYKNQKIEQIFTKKADFLCIFIEKSQIFAKKVHKKDFDLGLFFYSKNKKTYLKLYDGTGHIASSFVTNIFDNFFAMDKIDFEKEKKIIEKQYSKINKSKLIVQ